MGVSVELGINVTGASGIKCLLDNLGFSNFWNNQLYDVPHFFVIRNRICDHFMQHWYVNICNSPKLGYYSQFKTEFNLKNISSALQTINSLKNLQPFALVPIILILNLGDIAMFLERTGYVAYAQCKCRNRNTISY